MGLMKEPSKITRQLLLSPMTPGHALCLRLSVAALSGRTVRRINGLVAKFLYPRRALCGRFSVKAERWNER
jgi:hypothetical protein